MSREILEVLIRLRDQFSPIAQKLVNVVNDLQRRFDLATIASQKLTKFIYAGSAGILAASIKAYAETERLTMAFTSLLGSEKAAKDALAELFQFAKKTPFELGSIGQLAQMLMALGFRFEETIPLLRTIGDAVSALGGSRETLVRVARALAQIRSSAVASAQDLNQLAQAGIPVWEIISEKMGITVQQLRDAMSQGLISAQDTFTAIIQGMQERYAGMMEKQANTLLGIYSNIKDNLQAIFSNLGERFVNAFRIREGMKRFERWLENVSDLLEKGAIDEKLQAIADAAKNVGAALAGMMAPALWSQFRRFVSWVLLAGRVLAPWALIGIAVYKVLEKLGFGFDDLVEVLKRVASAFVGLYHVSAGVANILTNILAVAIESVLANLEGMMQRVKLNWQALQVLFDTTLPFSERWQRHLELRAQAAEIKLKNIAQIMEEHQPDMEKAGEQVRYGFSLIVDAFTGAENVVTKTVESFADGFGELKDELKDTLDNLNNVGKGLNTVGEDTKGTKEEVEELVRWTDKLNDSFDRLLGNIQRWKSNTGQLGASEKQPEEAPTPRPEFPIVAPTGGTPPVAGGAPLKELYLTPEQLQRMKELKELYGSLHDAGVRYLYVTQDQVEAWEAWKATLKDLEEAAAGYAAELDENAYTAGAARRTLETLEEQYKSLRLSMEAAGRTTLYITQNEYKQHQEALKELNYYVAGYAAELDEATYQLAKERDAQEEAAKAAEEHAKKVERLNEVLRDLKYSIPTELADALTNLVESGDWQRFGETLNNIFVDAVGAAVDAIIPGLGRVISAIGRFFITLARKVNEWFESFSTAGQRRLRAQAEQQQRQLAEGFTFVSAQAFSTIQEHTQRFLFWTRKTFSVVVNEQAKVIAQTLDSAVVSALTTGIRAFLTGAKDWRKQFSNAIKSAILEGVIQAIVQQAVLQGLLGPALDKLTKDLAEGSWEAAQRDMEEVMARASQAADWLEGTFARYRDFFKDLAPETGPELGPGGAPPAEFTAPSTPSIRLTVPTAVLPGFQFQQLIPAFDRLSTAIDRLVDEGVRANVEVTVNVNASLFGQTLVTAG